MSAPTLDAQIETLRDLRLDAAARSQVLAERELAGRELRLVIESDLQTEGRSMTAAEKAAKVDARYLNFERETNRLQFELHRVEAEAEAAYWGLRLQVTVLERVGIP